MTDVGARIAVACLMGLASLAAYAGDTKKMPDLQDATLWKALVGPDWYLVGGMAGHFQFFDQSGQHRFAFRVAGSGVPIIGTVPGAAVIFGKRLRLTLDRPGQMIPIEEGETSSPEFMELDYDTDLGVFRSPSRCGLRLARLAVYQSYFPGDGPEVWKSIRARLGPGASPATLREALFLTAQVASGGHAPDLPELMPLLSHSELEVRRYAEWAAKRVRALGIYFEEIPPIRWGEPLKIAGTVKGPAAALDKAEMLRIWIDAPTSYSSFMAVLGHAPFQLQKQGEAARYRFSLDVAPRLVSELGPGSYRAHMDFGAVEGLLSFTVTADPAGWRERFAEGLAKLLCESKGGTAGIFASLKEYFRLLDILAVEERSPQGVEADKRQLGELWRKGFAPYAALITPEVRARLNPNYLPALRIRVSEKIANSCLQDFKKSAEQSCARLLNGICSQEIPPGR